MRAHKADREEGEKAAERSELFGWFYQVSFERDCRANGFEQTNTGQDFTPGTCLLAHAALASC